MEKLSYLLYIFQLTIFDIFEHRRVLGFRRAYPIVGRKVNATSEIYDISYRSLRHTFFKSPPPFNRTCFFGECHYYCDHHHAFCGNPEMIEGSFAAFMPEFDAGLRDVCYLSHIEMITRYCNIYKNIKYYRE